MVLVPMREDDIGHDGLVERFERGAEEGGVGGETLGRVEEGEGRRRLGDAKPVSVDGAWGGAKERTPIKYVLVPWRVYCPGLPPRIRTTVGESCGGGEVLAGSSRTWSKLDSPW